MSLRKLFWGSYCNLDEERARKDLAGDPHTADARCTPRAARKPTKDSAPNISLNLSPRKRVWERFSMAVIGVVVQITALIVMGLVTYHWNLQKGNKPVVPYAYPLAIIGTGSLVLGMFICATVIERSTKEVTWVKGPGAAHLNLHVLWLQRSGSVSDQSFQSFDIIAKGAWGAILTSRRRENGDPLVVPGDAYPNSTRKRKMK